MDRTVSLHILGVIALEEFSVMWYFDFFFCYHFQVNLPKGYGYVQFKTRGDAEKALLYMDGVGFCGPNRTKFHNQACWPLHLETDAFIFCYAGPNRWQRC